HNTPWKGGAVAGLLLLGTTSHAQADLFDTARKAVTVNSARQDTSGVTIRGGVNLTTGVQSQSTTILRGQVQTGGSCNAFDFGASIKEAFEDIPEIFATLGQELLGSLPIYVTCALDPGLCDLMKHFQALKNITVQLKTGRCQQVQTAMAYMGSRMRGGEEGKCLEDQVNAGVPLGRAMDLCSKGLPFLTAPDGTQTQQVNVVQQTLQAAGASPETQPLAKTLLGDVTLRTTGGRFDAQASSNPGALLALYEANRGTAAATLDQALEELRTTGTVSDATMQQISGPGQPIPPPVPDPLLAPRHDPTRSPRHR